MSLHTAAAASELCWPTRSCCFSAGGAVGSKCNLFGDELIVGSRLSAEFRQKEAKTCTELAALQPALRFSEEQSGRFGPSVCSASTPAEALASASLDPL
jgi:hypothetical protein